MHIASKNDAPLTRKHAHKEPTVCKVWEAQYRKYNRVIHTIKHKGRVNRGYGTLLLSADTAKALIKQMNHVCVTLRSHRY